MKEVAKEGGAGGGREGSALGGFAGGSAGSARLDPPDYSALSDPALYLKYLDRGLGEAR